MKLALKVALGIILAFTFIVMTWAVLSFGSIFALSKVLESAFHSNSPALSDSRNYLLKPPPASSFVPSAPPLDPAPSIKVRRTKKHYEVIWVPGKPLEECLGPSKELNENVLRCRNGYNKKVPVYE